MKKETFEEYTEDYKPSFVDLADTLPEQETIEEVNPFKLPKALPDDVFYESLKPKQETLEEACLNYSTDMLGSFYEEVERAFAKGAKWQQERSYSEEEVYNLILKTIKDCYDEELERHYAGNYRNLKIWFEQNKKK